MRLIPFHLRCSPQTTKYLLFRLYSRSMSQLLRTHPTPQPVPIPPNLRVQLTPEEEQLCSLFVNCTAQLKSERGIDTVGRIAGGWVRDKLLGLESNDIDIALSNIMGEPFANFFATFANSQGIETGKIATVKANPDQSKHLETAKLSLFGIDLDFVNLRSEEYTDASRIPTEVTFGTPLEDALRRDTTINSLFYNIHTLQVEDQTGKGLDDLRNTLIRTPLPPRQTFLDDPLRVIRCFRFASRFGFRLDSELSQSVKDPEIQQALVEKVTRERVGEELFKMLKGRDPFYSIRLIHDHAIFDSVFRVLPKEMQRQLSSQPEDSSLSLAAVTILNQLISQPSTTKTGADPQLQLPPIHPSLLDKLSADPTSRTRLYLAATLTPYRNVNCPQKKKIISLVELSIRESLRIGAQSHLVDGVPVLFQAHKLIGLPKLDDDRFNYPSERVSLGRLLRDKMVHNPNTGSHWSTSILFSLVQELLACYDLESDILHVDQARTVVEIFNTFARRIEEYGLARMTDAKPLIDGRTVVSVLNAEKPGQWTGKVLNEVIDWQLEYPQGSVADCKAWLKRRHDAGEINIGEGNGSASVKEPASKKVRIG